MLFTVIRMLLTSALVFVLMRNPAMYFSFGLAVATIFTLMLYKEYIKMLNVELKKNGDQHEAGWKDYIFAFIVDVLLWPGAMTSQIARLFIKNAEV